MSSVSNCNQRLDVSSPDEENAYFIVCIFGVIFWKYRYSLQYIFEATREIMDEFFY